MLAVKEDNLSIRHRSLDLCRFYIEKRKSGGESMFRSLSNPKNNQASIQITINDRVLQVSPGVTVWTAMALAGETATRKSPVNQQDRSAYCAMGVCFECMVEIDGIPNRQACLTEVQDGSVIRFQVITEGTIAEVDQPSSSAPSAEGEASD